MATSKFLMQISLKKCGYFLKHLLMPLVPHLQLDQDPSVAKLQIPPFVSELLQDPVEKYVYFTHNRSP